MPDFDFAGLDQAVQAAYKPYFADVVRRTARRRRRTRAAGAVLAVAAVTAVAVSGVTAAGWPGGGPAEFAGPAFDPERTPEFIPTFMPTPPPVRQGAKAGAMVAGDLDHLYLRWHNCRAAEDCAPMVAATSDGGATWHSYPLPAGRNAIVDLRAVGPRTLVAWVQEDFSPDRQTWHASTDGGATWRDVHPRTVPAIPTGWRVLPGFDFLRPGTVNAVDPATGDVVALAARPLALAEAVGNLPPAAGLWVSGYLGIVMEPPPNPARPNDNVGGVSGIGSAVEASHDDGRTWQRYVFPEQVTATDDDSGSVAIATDDGRTVYAVGRVGSALRIYRSLDGGKTWERTAAQRDVGLRPIQAAMGPDGRLVIQAGPEQNAPVLLFESVDGGATVREVPPGPGGSAARVPGGYAQSGWPWTSGAWLSPDGTQWSFVNPPKLP